MLGNLMTREEILEDWQMAMQARAGQPDMVRRFRNIANAFGESLDATLLGDENRVIIEAVNSRLIQPKLPRHVAVAELDAMVHAAVDAGELEG